MVPGGWAPLPGDFQPWSHEDLFEAFTLRKNARNELLQKLQRSQDEEDLLGQTLQMRGLQKEIDVLKIEIKQRLAEDGTGVVS